MNKEKLGLSKEFKIFRQQLRQSLNGSQKLRKGKVASLQPPESRTNYLQLTSIVNPYLAMTTSNYRFAIFLLLLTSIIFNIVARPINVDKSIDYADDAMDISGLAAIKIGGGPSAGGRGHEFPNANPFGNIKNSGPSPGGKGHDFINGKILGEIKNSGPSPGGKGHGLPNAISLGNVKHSGPSQGGEGH
ncbi:hypothetical protein L1887_11704 [Cichorium endivia]|nr:hypothetical protein L1887_11704 [Cichorium endivia]